MIDYLERESGQADALEEQRRRLAAALTSAAAGERGGGADLSGVEEIGSLAARWSVLRRESDPGLNVTEEELENVKKNSAVTRENGCGGGC